MAIISKETETEQLWTSRLSSAPLFITLLLPLIIGVLVVFKCLFNHCCIRKTTTKEELFGVEGRMTILPNSESSLSHNNASTIIATSTNNNNSRPSSSISLTTGSGIHDTKKQIIHLQQASTGPNNLISDTVDGCDIFAETFDLTDSLRATVKRQLPDPPKSPSHAPRRSSSILSQDGASELYEEVPALVNSTLPSHTKEHLYSKVIKPKNGKATSSRHLDLDGKNASNKNSGEPNPSSDSETYATNVTNAHHPYAKLKRPITVEHPYARVGVGNRVRTESTGTGGDEAEETDTDNYDVAHPYAQINRMGRNQNPGTSTGREAGSGQLIDSNPGTNTNNEGASTDNNSSTSASNTNHSTQLRRSQESEPNAEIDNAPVPPRRIGRQWRRSSHPQAQPNANDTMENQVLFSGDSQDSRGYSHLSVREPLSNIKSETRKNSDPNYAMSDDSEEMYAAIEDPADGYMSIHDRPSWLGPTSLVSPIPERREANSPLPPPPLLSPLTMPTSESPLAAALSKSTGEPAIYAQVTKRKKNKAPSSPTGTGGATANQFKTPSSAELPSTSKSRPQLDTGNAPAQSVNTESEPRRWSKADISYSEFEVVRESLFPSAATGSGNINSQNVSQKQKALFSSADPAKHSHTSAQTIVDEDNYNIIPESRISIVRPSDDRHSLNRRHRVTEDMYQEIDDFSKDNRNTHPYPYQEIQHRPSNTDHYHEIGSNRRRKRNKSSEKKTENHPPSPYQRLARKNTEGEDSDDEDEDDFYEKVKCKPRSEDNQFKPNSSTNPNTDKKHGYEKLKRKPNEVEGAEIISIASDEDLETGLYESVKYPSYSKLQGPPLDRTITNSNRAQEDSKLSKMRYDKKQELHVSRDHFSEKSQVESFQQGARGTVKPTQNPLPEHSQPNNADVDQLYAVVDKTKKKRKEQDLVADEKKQTKTYESINPKKQLSMGQGNSNVSNSNRSRSTEQALSKDVTIEYI